MYAVTNFGLNHSTSVRLTRQVYKVFNSLAKIVGTGFDGDEVGPEGRVWPCPLFLLVHLLESRLKGGLP